MTTTAPSSKRISLILPFLVVIVLQMSFAIFSVQVLSAIRSCMTGENLWLQAQRNAENNLRRYARSGSDADLEAYKAAIGVPTAIRDLQLALDAAEPDLQAAQAALVREGIQPDDADRMLWLVIHFSKVSYIADAMTAWKKVNAMVPRFDRLAADVQAERPWATDSAAWSQSGLRELDALDAKTTPLAAMFDQALTAGARLVERALAVVNLTLAAALTVLIVWRYRRFIDQRKTIEGALSWQATHDPLTGIANRRAFESRLTDAMAGAAGRQAPYALMILDLDQFKIVNDTCGHAAGDDLLRRICVPLQNELRDGDLLARLGGDEFGVLLSDGSSTRAIGVAERLRAVTQNFDFMWDLRVFRVTASIGLALTDKGLHSPEDMMRAADMACYMAKEKGRNRVHLHRSDDEDLARHAGDMNWVQRIHQALKDDRFCLYAQEIAALGAGRDDGIHVELLIRLQDENGDLVPPGHFLPAAERFGLMTLIDRWVVRAAFQTLAARRKDADAEPIACCAINLSGTTVGDEAFLGFLDQAFAEFGIPPSTICFEITETSAITNIDMASSFVRDLQALGCRFSLDDFGSGMSSFHYLKHLPVDFLKIDGGFVKNLLNNDVDRAMVESINHIGHVMGKCIIAEFVESDGLVLALEKIGVDYGQGFGIARPKPFDLNYRSVDFVFDDVAERKVA